MLDNEKTVQKFGYDPQTLSNGSHQKVILTCDYCGKEHEKEYKSRNRANTVVNKDACWDCRFKKREEISLKSFGVKNSAQRKEVRQKISEASSERLKSDEFKEQAKATNLKRYGYEFAQQNDEIKEKAKKTMQERYGVDNPFESEELREKAKQTCIERYGDECPARTEEGQARIIAGFQKKYGCDNAFQSEEVKDKIKQTCLNKYGFDHHMKDPERAKQNGQNIRQIKIDSGTIKLYEGKTAQEWAKEVGYSRSRFGALIQKYGFEFARTMEPRVSSLEKIVAEWLKEANIEYEQHHKVESKIADFYLPTNKILIEADGLYWHSDAITEEDDYHIKKRQLYIVHGYTPLFFRENEILTQFDIVKSIILNKLGKSNRIFARKCVSKEVDRETARKFFKDNHLMGNGTGKTYGLYFGDSLVTALQLRGHREGYEISRFCHSLNTNVVGGFSKLISQVRTLIGDKTLLTFIDLRYGGGKYLESLGFTYKHTYPSFKWTDGNETYNRMQFPGNLGYEKQLAKLWDCGQAKYVLSNELKRGQSL